MYESTAKPLDPHAALHLHEHDGSAEDVMAKMRAALHEGREVTLLDAEGFFLRAVSTPSREARLYVVGQATLDIPCVTANSAGNLSVSGLLAAPAITTFEAAVEHAWAQRGNIWRRAINRLAEQQLAVPNRRSRSVTEGGADLWDEHAGEYASVYCCLEAYGLVSVQGRGGTQLITATHVSQRRTLVLEALLRAHDAGLIPCTTSMITEMLGTMLPEGIYISEVCPQYAPLTHSRDGRQTLAAVRTALLALARAGRVERVPEEEALMYPYAHREPRRSSWWRLVQ